MDKQYLDHLRHSAAHLLAAAVMELWPDTKRTIGPAIENGFYFDFEFSNPITEKDLSRIEQKMREILKSWSGFERHELDAEAAKAEFPGNEFKHELIEQFSAEGQTLSFYKSGDYWDLCRGGHVDNPKEELKNFKLLSIAGAYWRGDEKNKMLTRIYGTAFPTKEELEQHLWQLEEAKKRDHRKLGRELDLFTLSDLVGSGLPMFTPRGTVLREELNKYSQELREERGFQKVWTPHITKNDLYKTSGHWDKFGDELFLVKSQETTDQMVLKPMNCPHHQQIYASKPRSYKDLPLKYMETTTDYRDEKAGELQGLSRVRALTQDDSHTFVTPEQIEEVYQELIDITEKFFSTLDMKYRVRLSFRDPKQPEKYLGDDALWEKAQAILLKIAKNNNLDYFEAEGEAAFYGPKMDFMVHDALGRQWQLATPQLDFNQPARFGLTYTDKDGSEQTPIMIHYALMGSLERFLAVYIEHTAGAFPAWVAPEQVRLIPISDQHLDYANKVKAMLVSAKIRHEIDASPERMQKKVKIAQDMKVPYMLILGGKEAESGTVSIRYRTGEQVNGMKLEEFVAKLKENIDGRKLNIEL